MLTGNGLGLIFVGFVGACYMEIVIMMVLCLLILSFGLWLLAGYLARWWVFLSNRNPH